MAGWSSRSAAFLGSAEDPLSLSKNDDDLAEFHEIVLTNGDKEAVLTYVISVELMRLWPQLRLPVYVRAAWDERLAAVARR